MQQRETHSGSGPDALPVQDDLGARDLEVAHKEVVGCADVGQCLAGAWQPTGLAVASIVIPVQESPSTPKV